VGIADKVVKVRGQRPSSNAIIAYVFAFRRCTRHQYSLVSLCDAPGTEKAIIENAAPKYKTGKCEKKMSGKPNDVLHM